MIKIAVKQIISDVYNKHSSMMLSDVFKDEDREYYYSINDKMSDADVSIALNRLGGYMEKCFGKKAIILLDEYDTPMQEAWIAGNWD